MWIKKLEYWYEHHEHYLEMSSKFKLPVSRFIKAGTLDGSLKDCAFINSPVFVNA